MVITALSVCSENADHYTYIMKTKRKPSNAQIKKFLKEEHNFYLDYDLGMKHPGWEWGEIELGFINSSKSILIDES